MLTNSAEDAIIHQCWNGQYRLFKELSAELTDGVGQDEPAYKDPSGWRCDRDGMQKTHPEWVVGLIGEVLSLSRRG